MLELALLLQFLHLIIRLVAASAGSVGIYALVCSALHPNPTAAAFAMVALPIATSITLALPSQSSGAGR